jgi:hypothetical protein
MEAERHLNPPKHLCYKPGNRTMHTIQRKKKHPAGVRPPGERREKKIQLWDSRRISSVAQPLTRTI